MVENFIFKVSAAITAVLGCITLYQLRKYKNVFFKPIVKLNQLENYCNEEVFIEGVVEAIKSSYADDENVLDNVCFVKKEKSFTHSGSLMKTNYIRTLVTHN